MQAVRFVFAGLLHLGLAHSRAALQNSFQAFLDPG
jgi:hypothetical protein